MIIKESHFDTQETQPFFRYWLLAIKARVGDEIPIYEYIIWNNQQVVAFKQSIGEPLHKPLCHIDDGIKRFGEYLKSLSEQDYEQLALEI